MIYLISYTPNFLYQQTDIHDFITNHLNQSDWWFYTNVYLLDTTLSINQITSSLRGRFPGLQHFVTKVDLKDNGGLLPKDAWDWINKKTGAKVKLKGLPSPLKTGLPPIRVSEPKKKFTVQELLAAIEQLKDTNK